MRGEGLARELPLLLAATGFQTFSPISSSGIEREADFHRLLNLAPVVWCMIKTYATQTACAFRESA